MLTVNETWKIFRWRCVDQRDNMCYWWEPNTDKKAEAIMSTSRRCIKKDCPRLEKS